VIPLKKTAQEQKTQESGGFLQEYKGNGNGDGNVDGNGISDGNSILEGNRNSDSNSDSNSNSDSLVMAIV
jgi:hypothetical protein